ncbi:MAG: tRNA (guanosine(46)-N7)-methyltransferase TrmB [Verrucomicrobia bacterium]|nr:tRNA (guanosine(46)-N7)-methyltransferase TrmB [Verrucomicrobiota bacterium]
MESASCHLESSLLYRLPSIVDRLDLSRMFVQAQPLHVELGSGDGSFLAQFARKNPDRNFIGIERLLGRLRKLDRKGRRLGLTNLAGLRIECAYFLEYLLPPESAEAIHVYFPDPWPKRKHARNRLVGERFPSIARMALQMGGVVYLRTDHVGYFEQMQEVFRTAPQFELMETPEELRTVVTDFEAEFLLRGIPSNHAAYKRVA